MFVLTVLQDTLRIPPHNLSLPLQDALTRQICSLYFDKVLKDLGLCVTLYDIKAVEGGFVFPGDGAPRFTVDFRLVMFRPFVGEVLIAKLKTCDKSGLYLSLGSFFDDIHIPEHLLQQPSTFDEDEKLWVWNYNGTPMYMDLDEDVRFRVVQVKYPPIPIEQEKNAKPFAPMQITGDVNADGLGLVAWWS
ncbi:hypothetical protein BDL97_01G199200 [Sphagnum fallax]|uniref:Uncharacterized protein n=2 Tax=Sphagnum jensenii TaxID=128206 RepID=A0ABP1A8Z5_9BRYO|nr:hypothetical protein BDL97_01G199200 [Sphagnum fallax]KAH8976162.1 hypothetical protein BDL97_01G199200 [Sphagnum fallax]